MGQSQRIAFLGMILVIVGFTPDAATRDLRAPALQPARAPQPTPPATPNLRDQIDGHTFPDHVLALTWDDGPDKNTLALAEYLKKARISATFFVIDSWINGVSSDPGWGTGVYTTGAKFIPILDAVVKLGHRIGNHTLNHVLLWDAPEAQVHAQLAGQQRKIDPFIEDELTLFRVPGGAWSTGAADLASHDLPELVGPIRWDIDRKDWDSSVQCISSHPRSAQVDCEARGPGGSLRVSPSVVAARYLATIEAQKHGIVLLHDRVGHVGSRYALDIAEALIPALKAKGYVFAPPVLRFSPLRTRFADAPEGKLDFLALGDIDGDGRADLCMRDLSGEIVCAPSERRANTPLARPETRFGAPREMNMRSTGEFYMADIDGDRVDDLCTWESHDLTCTLIKSGVGATSFRTSDFAPTQELRFGDLDDDHKADVCGASAHGIRCARSLGDRFERARVWAPFPNADGAGDFQLGDVDGDGRADLCARTARGIVCALSNGVSFGNFRIWSTGGDFSDADSIRLGDLNGDGRADICGRAPGGVVCAFSTGRFFTRSTNWLHERARSFVLSDINGDARADLCGVQKDGVVCGLAP